ncbi:MAG: hypothetical protein WD039_06265 [Xanthobacteraceae bacterium]
MIVSRDPAVSLLRLALTIGVLLAVLACVGCSSSVIDSVPNWAGGEPAGTPERPAVEAQYPPVNDRPPPRDAQLITEEEQTRIEQELAAARAAQAARAKQMQKDREGMLANTPQPPAKPVNPPAN